MLRTCIINIYRMSSTRKNIQAALCRPEASEAIHAVIVSQPLGEILLYGFLIISVQKQNNIATTNLKLFFQRVLEKLSLEHDRYYISWQGKQRIDCFKQHSCAYLVRSSVRW